MRLRQIALALFVLSLPVIVVSVLLATQLDATLLDHAPYWNDELFHWHQAATMAEAGFNGGYYSLDENIPLAQWSHYYAWGAYTYVPYALAMTIFGQGLTVFQFTNLALFTLAIIAFIGLARLDEGRLLALGVVLATFIPLLNYLPSSMLQLLHLAIAAVIAGAFYRLLTDTVSGRFMLIFGGFLLLVGLLRPTWTTLLLPALILQRKTFTPRSVLRAFVIAVPVTLLAATLFYTSAAPFPHFRTRLFLGDATLIDKVFSFLEYIWISLGWMLEGDPIAMVQRYQFALLIPLLLLWGAWQWRRGHKFEMWGWEWLLHLFNLLGFYVLTIMFHETLGSHDYRVMAPHLLLSLLLFVALRRYALLGVVIALTLLFFPTLIDNFQWKALNFNGIVAQEYQQWREPLAEVMAYDESAPNNWCNTVVLSSLYALGQGPAGVVLAIDAGIGLTWAYDWDETGRFSMPETYQAAYMMLTPQDVERLSPTVPLDYLRDVPDGAIYRNGDSTCP